MNCKEIIECFLIQLNINETSYKNALKKLELGTLDDRANVEYRVGESVINQILVDVYHLNANSVKDISNELSKIKPIGRHEKNIIKHFLDYRDKDSLDLLNILLKEHNISKEELLSLLTASEDLTPKAVELFYQNWKFAEANQDDSKKQDFLQSIYTRLASALNTDRLSLADIFEYNKKYIESELKEEYRKRLYDFCSCSVQMSSVEARKLFNEKYNEILKDSLQDASNNNLLEPSMNRELSKNTPFDSYNTEDYSLVVLNINQKLFDKYSTFDKFINVVLNIIQNTYRILENHRAFAINIENIYDENNLNVKWKLYSYLGIYAEHFIPTKERRKFYKPEELCLDKARHIGVDISKDSEKDFKLYFDGRISKTELASSLFCTPEEIDEILLDFQNVWYGFTFSDCIIIKTAEQPQHKEFEFIKNENSLLFIFNKYRHDDRKIPCPDCAGLNISGNSFPEIGLRSWECKNDFCPSRSKSNRGKRYSKKSNFMQSGFSNHDDYDMIPRELIKQWRRDICETTGTDDIFEMLIKYFSFHNEKILFLNCDSKVIDISISHERMAEILKPEDINYEIIQDVFTPYFQNGPYIKRFLNQKQHKTIPPSDRVTNNITNHTDGVAVLVNGDSRKILSRLKEETITSAVTSPPYYNARLYSQWSNLYLYLSDMYEIIKETYRVMKKGGIYLYNIGDICGNENTVVRSNMGDKRILLGSYTVNLFLNAGFELIDNIIWDKGEPQSNRQKNDGKFTPFYQKPMNVYEHMFVFKKPGAPAIINNKTCSVLPDGWNKNVVSFSPVIKINSKGENILGHTAPFPEDIPKFVSRVFNQSSNDIVLDPFVGAGTTLFAAAKANIKSLGIEISREYCDLILNRAKEDNVEIKYFDN